MLAQLNHLRRLRDLDYFIEIGHRENSKTFSYMTTHFLRSFEDLFKKKNTELHAGEKLITQLGELQKRCDDISEV
jgi:hypothetical protein